LLWILNRPPGNPQLSDPKRPCASPARSARAEGATTSSSRSPVARRWPRATATDAVTAPTRAMHMTMRATATRRPVVVPGSSRRSRPGATVVVADQCGSAKLLMFASGWPCSASSTAIAPSPVGIRAAPPTRGRRKSNGGARRDHWPCLARCGPVDDVIAGLFGCY
jgi:hypothetical protein